MTRAKLFFEVKDRANFKRREKERERARKSLYNTIRSHSNMFTIMTNN